MADDAPGFLGAVVTPCIIASAVLAIRLYFRYKIGPIDMPIWLEISALIAALVQTALIWAAIALGLGQSNLRADHDQITGCWLIQISYLSGNLGIALEKFSTAVQLWNFGTQVTGTVWSRFFWSTIVLQVLLTLTVLALQVVQMDRCAKCWPIEASSDHRIPDELCREPTLFQAYISIMGVGAIVINFILASLFSLTFYKSKLPPSQKYILIVLAYLGVFFYFFTGFKLASVNRLEDGKTPDVLVLFNNVASAKWAVLEVLIGIVVGCLITFTPPARALLRRLGYLFASGSKVSVGTVRSVGGARRAHTETATETAAKRDRDRRTSDNMGNANQTDRIEMGVKDVESGSLASLSEVNVSQGSIIVTHTVL